MAKLSVIILDDCTTAEAGELFNRAIQGQAQVAALPPAVIELRPASRGRVAARPGDKTIKGKVLEALTTKPMGMSKIELMHTLGQAFDMEQIRTACAHLKQKKRLENRTLNDGTVVWFIPVRK